MRKLVAELGRPVPKAVYVRAVPLDLRSILLVL